MFERITFDPKIMGGRACIRGMRVSVSVIVEEARHRVRYFPVGGEAEDYQ